MPNHSGTTAQFVRSRCSIRYGVFNCWNANYRRRPESFLGFLEFVSNGDQQMVDFLFELLGYWVSNYAHVKSFFVITGERNCGKSSFLKFVEQLIGESFVSNVPLHKLDKQFLTAQLFMKKINNGCEISAITLKEDGLLKTLTGNSDRVTAEHKYCDPFTFQARIKLIFATNNIFDIQVKNLDSEALRKRLKLIQFNGSIREENIEEDIVDKWMSEIDDIMPLIINGLNRLVCNNFIFTNYEQGLDMDAEFDSLINPTLSMLLDFANDFCFLDIRAIISVEQFVNKYNNIMNQNLTVDEFSKSYAKSLEQQLGIIKKKGRVDGTPLSALYGIGLK